MKAVKVVFKDGVFVPVEPCSAEEGCEGIVVYSPCADNKPLWWEKISVPEEKKEALKLFSERVVSKVVPDDIKVVVREEEFEVFVLVPDETTALKPIMEEALRLYEERRVYIPVQVISRKRLKRWEEQGNQVFREISEGVSIK